MEIKKCLQCGNEYVPHDIPLQQQKFCSKNCRAKYHNIKRSELFYKLLGKEKFTPTLKICIICNNEYTANVVNQKFCSNKCRSYYHNNSNKLTKETIQPRPIYELDKEFRGHLIGYTKLEKKILIFYIDSIDGYYYAIHHLSYFFIPPTLK